MRIRPWSHLEREYNTLLAKLSKMNVARAIEIENIEADEKWKIDSSVSAAEKWKIGTRFETPGMYDAMYTQLIKIIEEE